jgi:hypothetical protein
MSDELLQSARDIAVETFLQVEIYNGKKPAYFKSYETWLKHLLDYTQYLREGAYDDGLPVQAVMTALKQVQS